LFEQKRLIFGERIERAGAAVSGRGRIMRKRGVFKVERRLKDGQSMECRPNIGNSGVQNLLSQLTELTTSLYVFDKQWHTCL